MQACGEEEYHLASEVGEKGCRVAGSGEIWQYLGRKQAGMRIREKNIISLKPRQWGCGEFWEKSEKKLCKQDISVVIKGDELMNQACRFLF